MNFSKTLTKIHDAFLIHPKAFGDSRGFFLESWSKEAFKELGLDFDFVQDNHSRSSKGVLRGLHYQSGDTAQGKLVRVSSGIVYDVFVDLRKSSPSFGIWDGVFLTEEQHEMLWVPPGCAHGFLVVSDVADFQYKVTAPYNSKTEKSLLWNDPTLNISWPLEGIENPLVSSKDAQALHFEDCEKYT